ncbi:hypothetical protein LPJ66_006508 [Kickxella alabastrina]|uniref:Uncharacterized protein n=1 Tax=Kickxella alabastrina TaxID=61397 RepID=A0ACC1IDX8_9FUNG|nr:hypothetical protein LPJ66_006508 [Kickxella alabastrina]
MAPTATSAQMEARPWNDSSVMDSGYPCTNPKAAEEREHKRRKSHSQMERRRRERTNAVINDLKALIPSLQNRDKPQKLEVLEKCVQYIRELQSTANFPLSSLKRRRHRVQSFDSKVERFGQESDDERNSCASHYLTSASPLQRRRRLSVTVKNSTSLSSPFSSMLPSGGGAIWSSAMPLSNARAAGDRVVTAIDAVSADTCTEDWGAFGRQLTGNNLPDLAVHSAVSSSSNASPIKSNIVLFHSPLPMISCDSDFKKLASANTAGLSRQSSPGGKTSIDFLIT